MLDRRADGEGADQISIERCGLEQLSDVKALARSCADAPHWPPNAWQNFVQPSPQAGDRRSVLLLALEPRGELVGWLAASGIYETAELEFLLVHPTHRGRGVAIRLMEHWLRWAKSEGALEAVLEVRPSNTAAIRLYSRCGLVERGSRQRYYQHPPEDALLMWRCVGEARATDRSGEQNPLARQV